MSMGKAPSRSVSLPKLERKVQEGLALSPGEMKVMRRATALAAAKPSPNATNYGLTERVAKERAIVGTDRMDAALGRGTTTGTDKMLAFVYDRVENTGFGGHTSAGRVYSQTPFSLAGLKAAPRLEAKLDCRHPDLVALQADKEANFGRLSTNWHTNDDVGSCMLHGSPTGSEKAAAKQRIRELKRRLKDEKHARRALERSASEAGVPLPRGDGPRSWLDPPGAPPLPEGWFETCDALGARVWCHVQTKHSVRHRPTDETPVEPPVGQAPGQGLPKNWYETRDAGEKHHGETIWRNSVTTEFSRHRPADWGAGVGADGASIPSGRSPNGVSPVYVPGRDAPKASRAEMVGREIQMRRARAMHAQSIHAQAQQVVQAGVSPTRRRVG